MRRKNSACTFNGCRRRPADTINYQRSRGKILGPCGVRSHPIRFGSAERIMNPLIRKGVGMEQRILLAAVLAVCICMELVGKRPAWAQSGPAAQRVEQVMRELQLTPQQKLALLPVFRAEA